MAKACAALGHNTGDLSSNLLITGASQLLTLRGRVPRRGKFLSDIGIIRDGALLVRDGAIAAVGTRLEIESLPESRTAEKLDVGGRVALPGFVDSHSVKKLRAATAESLKKRAHAALREFAEHGTTTLEAKSGYGLNVASELKILRLHKELSVEQPLEIVSTFLGAHVVPAEFRDKPEGAEQYIALLTDKLIPEVAETELAEFCDVFCDRGAFSRKEANKILRAARKKGLFLRVHAEQLTRTGATRLGVKLGAASCDHLEQVNKADIQALARSKTAATLLPGCDFHLGLKKYAPARALIEAGAIVALATDYNPGTSPTMSMPMILSLACTQLRMSPAEAIAAATVNAAYSLLRDHKIGSLETGKQADIAIFDVEDYREIPYYFGVNKCWMTLKKGQPVFQKTRVSGWPLQNPL